MDWSKQQLEAMKAILVDWSSMSRGDISCISLMIREPGAIETSAGTPHARFWHNVVQIGWAEQVYSLIDPPEVNFEPVCFRFLEGGEYRLARFLVAYDLMNMGVCTPAQDADMVKNEYRDQRVKSVLRAAKHVWVLWGVSILVACVLLTVTIVTASVSAITR